MIKALILHAPGTNRDNDLAYALELAGGKPEIIPLSILRDRKVNWMDFGLLALPGGFSYGDALGAGKLFALDLQTWFEESLQGFMETGLPVIGICNGFQALVKSGLLPGGDKQATLTFNQSARFECRWITLAPNKENSSPWLDNLKPIECPVAHGEGRFIMAGDKQLPASQIAFQYTFGDGTPANMTYPVNPNGSPFDIAGVTNHEGNILGLMPHPENHIHHYQHPGWTRSLQTGLGLELFRNGIRMAE